MVLTASDAVTLVVALLFSYWEPAYMGEKSKRWYEKSYKKLKWLPLPPMVFPFVWGLLKPMVALSFFFVIKYIEDTTSSYFIVYVSFFVAQKLTVAMWTALFFKMGQTRWALGNSAVSLLFAAITLIFQTLLGPWPGGVNAFPNGFWAFVTAFVFYLLYTIWLAVAMIINLDWVNMEERHPTLRHWNNPAPKEVLLAYEQKKSKHHHHHHHHHHNTSRGGPGYSEPLLPQV